MRGSTRGAAFAHPHVWVTVRSHVEFTPDGKVEAIVHDWVFDEMYSSFATQGLAPKGQLVTREIFAPLAQENAGGLAGVGYYTTLKIDGKTMEFAPVTEYWMEERPDHLVAFHVRLNLKTPEPIGRFGSLLVADPEFYIDFEFDDPPNGGRARPCAVGLLGFARPSRNRSRPATSRSSTNPSSPISRRGPISASRWRAGRSSRVP